MRKAIIYSGSNYFPAPPSSLSWILRSLDWRISSFFLFSFTPPVISLLSAHANRKPLSFHVLLGRFRISQLVSAERNPCALAVRSKQERDERGKKEIDW